jgi:hypothetical protein
MSKPDLVTIDLGTLTTVTGGKLHGGDPLINDLKYLTSSLKDLSKQTSGFSSNTMLLLCCLALQRNNGGFNGGNTNVVYVSRGRRW